MFCDRCGSPLPKEGSICKFCGAMMNSEQIAMQKEINKSMAKNPDLKSDRYGVNKNQEYRDTEKGENKALGFAIILVVVVILIFLAILINIAGR